MTTTTQRLKPTQFASIPDHRPTVVLCSSKDDYLLSQDICNLCGSLGKAEEGNLISCLQCGDCYHPYCVNIKGLKVVLTKGWRCLDCTVCEECREPGDEAKLLLCDECELSCHTYCLDPPLGDVPKGAWKCHRCVSLQRSGSPSTAEICNNDNNIKQILPTPSSSVNPHPSLTAITKQHLQSDFPRPQSAPLSSSPIELNNTDSIKRPSSSLHFTSNDTRILALNGNFIKKDFTNQDESNNINDENLLNKSSNTAQDDLFQGLHMVDGVYLSETGFNFMKSQKLEPAKRQRAKRGSKVQKIDDCNLDDTNRDDDEENKLISDDKVDDDGRKKRVRKLSKVGIGGFAVRQRGVRINKDDDFNYSLSNDVTEISTPPTQTTQPNLPTSQQDRTSETILTASANIKPKRIRKKPKKKTHLIDQYPSYLQEAFFGKDLLSDDFKSVEEKHPETLNNGSISEVQNEDMIEHHGDGSCRSVLETVQTRPNVKPLESTNEFMIDSNESLKTSDMRQLPKDLMEVFADGRMTDEHSEPKKDFDPDLLSTDFNLDDLSTTEVEDVLSSLDTQPTAQKLNPMPQVVEVYDQAPTSQSGMLNSNSTTTSHHHLHQQQQPQLNSHPQTMHPHVQSSGQNIPVQSTIHHIQPQQNQLTSASMSPHQVKPMQHQMSPNTIQHPQNHQMAPTPQHMNYEMGTIPMHSSNVNSMNQCNSDQNNPNAVNVSGQVLSPSLTLSPRTKISSPCLSNTHRPPSNASSIGGMPSQAQQPMHHPIPPPNQSNQPAMSPMIEPEAGNVHYQMPQSPWPGSQPDMSRQYSPHITNDPNVYQSSSQDIEAQNKKNANNWLDEERAGSKATKSAVLYANLEHPNLKQQHPNPEDRFKYIQKLWRQLAADKRKPYVDQARENRSASKVTNKAVNDGSISAPKKPGSQHLQSQPKMSHDGMHMQPQQVHNNQPVVVHQAQDTKWKQPMPIENQHQNNRFLSSPHSQRPAPHMQHDSTIVCHPPEVMSPSLRPMSDPATHYEHSPQPMISPQTSSPRPQFTRPPLQQHSMIQVSRVRPPTIDPNRIQGPDPYAMPPSTPRPLPIQQRSPFSPQSPFPPSHPGNPASSTSPITPRTPNEHQVMYQTNQQVPPMTQNQSQQQQPGFVDMQHQPHMQQTNQYPQLRQPHYTGQQRMANPMHQQQYSNAMPAQGPVVGGPMNSQPRHAMHSQQPNYQPQPQYRMAQSQTRYPNQHQDMHPHVGSPMQTAPQVQQMHQQRIQSPVMNRQIPQVGVQPQRMMNQPRMQHPIAQGQQQVPMRHVQQPQPQQQHHIPHPQMPQQQGIQQPQQHQMPMQQQQQQHLHPHPQQQSTPQPPNQQNVHMHYGSIPTNNRLEQDDATQLLEDEDDLKDLGADFNILEYADPEPEKGASTSAGKNNIELDAELADFYEEREALEEKRPNDQMLGMATQQAPQQQHQIMYNPNHQQPHQTVQMQQNQNFVEGQHHLQHQQQQQHQPNMIPQNQYSSQRQPLYITQRVAGPGNQQYAPNQQQVMRPQQGCAQVRIQHSQQPHQQQINYQQQHRAATPRYHNQNHMSHDIHQQGMINQQHINPAQQQQQRVSQMQPTQQYHAQAGFIDNQQPQQQVHGGHVQQQQQYAQHPQQQHMMYNNQQQQQMNVRRQFQPQQPQHQQPQQQYAYQPHPGNYPQMMGGAQQQQIAKSNNELMMHNKSPIVGEAITSMEFTMYEQGQGSNNEAVNLPIQSSDQTNQSSSNQVTGNQESSGLIQNQSISYNPPSNRPEVPNMPESIPRPAIDTNPGMVVMKQNQADPVQPNINKTDTGFRITPNTSSNQSGRLSSCSNNQDNDSSSQAQPSTGERSGNGGQPNQLLKQLLGNCSSADNPPNQEGSPILLVDTSSNKTTIPSTVHTMIPKPITSSNIPTISFHMDNSGKTVGPMIGGSQTLTAQTQLKGPNIIASSLQPQQRAPTIATANNYEIKTYNVNQPVAPVSNISIVPVSVRPQQSSTPIGLNPTAINRLDHQMDHQTDSVQQQHEQLNHGPPTLSISPPNIAAKRIKTQNGGVKVVGQPVQITTVNPVPTGSTGSMCVDAKPQAVKNSTQPKRKNDYIAARRAALEKEKTPPPKEVTKKKRVRGPNKRSNKRPSDGSDDMRPIDSNSNTSETNQPLEAPPPRKRVRKSQSKKSDLENNEIMMSSLNANKIHNELPMMPVREPEIPINNNVGSIFACGDLNLKSSKLRGTFGRAVPINHNIGSSNKKAKRKTAGFYHDELSNNLEDQSFEVYTSRIIPVLVERDCESPGSIISCSSSDYEDASDKFETKELTGQETVQSSNEFFTPDIDKYIMARNKSSHKPQENHNGSDVSAKMDINNNARSISPSIPIDIKLPTTYMPLDALDEDDQAIENNQENLPELKAEPTHSSRDAVQATDQTGTSLNMTLKDHGNVSVTLTLTNKEVDGVKRVLNSLSQLIDYPIPPSSVMQSPESVSPNQQQDARVNLSNSFKLLTGSSQNQSEVPASCHKDLKFNEQTYISTEESSKSILLKTEDLVIDVKPEFCCACKAIVVDRGIRKNIDEIPESTVISMQKASLSKKNQNGELTFCSVQCYANSIKCLSPNRSDTTPATTPPPESDDKKTQLYSVKNPPGLPPMSPMMEDDEDELTNNNRLQESDKTRAAEKNPSNETSLESSQRKRWADMRYSRCFPSYFEMNKSTSPIINEDIRDPTTQNDSSLSSASLLINYGDSSVDSNESDNSTSYSQSTSGGGKVANSLDDSFAQDLPLKSEQLTARNRHTAPRDPTNKDIISSWPEGMELVQVKPIKSITPAVTIKKEKNCDDNMEVDNQGEAQADIVEMYEDTRKCVLCHAIGDGDSDGPARLLNLYVDGWVHLNCALWSLDVYELHNGALMNVELACKKAMNCSSCHRPGATLKCFKPRCSKYYHFLCALKEKCSFYEDKSVQCRQHSKSTVKEMTSFVVKRRVYVSRDEQRQIAEMIQGDQQNVMRIGSLVFLNIGQLLPHQLLAFHDQNNIFPVGYKVIRYYWSFRRFNKRCKYLCTIEDNEGKPQFRIVAQEFGYEPKEFVGDSPHQVWRPIIETIIDLRKEVPDTITTFPAYIRGEDLFGLTEPSIVRILESLPGVETLTDYDFKFGRSPLLELPLAINPSGCARTEPKLKTHFKRPYTIHTANSVPKSRLQSASSSDSSSPYIKHFVHSKSSQYRKMKSEWRNNVVLARSRVQGLGLYAARDIEKHTMVIEYIGMLIRNEIAERYERIHEAHNRGIYMFRLDEDRVIDATLAGGLARYINHSCNPNCVAEAVEIDRERKILIIANRKILKGEELGYDYKLAEEDDQHKISCLCGAPTCKKWMN